MDKIPMLSEKARANLTKMFGPLTTFPSSLSGPPATDIAPGDPTEDPGIPDTVAPIINQEFGVSLESYYTRFELHQYSPDELITKKGFKIYEKMYTDDQIHMAITALKLMRLSSGYEINEASQDPRDIEIADFVADNFTKLEGSLQDTLFNLMGALEMGWSLNEKIWDFYEVGPWKGKVRLKALKSKNPQWFNPAVDDFNNVTGIVMISPPAFGRKLPSDKFIVYSFMKRYENVFGFSRTRALYDWWWIKHVTRRALGVFIEKFGHPVAIGKYPITMQPQNKKDLLTALQQLKIASAITLPDGCTVDFLEAGKQGAEAFLQTIEKCDQQIVKIIMGQTMSSGTSSAHTSGAGGGQQQGGAMGGKGAASQAQDVLNMYLEFIGRHLAENPVAAIIKELVDYNWEGVTNYPTFKFKSLMEKDLSDNVATWIQAATAVVGAGPDGTGGKAIVTSGPDDEELIRELLGFPSVQGKNALRPNRYKNKPIPKIVTPREVNPLQLPIGGYRPPTPAGPGQVANYAEKEWKPWRALTKYEKHVDFAESWKIIDEDGEDAITADAAAVIRKSIEKIKLLAKRVGNDSSKIKKIELPYRGELAAVLRDGLLGVAKKATRQARAEVRSAKKFADISSMAPQEVLDYIKDRSFTMSGDISDEVLKRVKNVMYNGVKAGKSYKDIVYDIENAIAPYIDLSQADSELSGSRLETAVRTSVAEAYNEARKSVFMDPDLEGFVLAFQFSAILDDRTTDWCEEYDGLIFKVSHPIWDELTPPVWYNCRSVLVPITQVDEWDGEESEEPKTRPPEGFK